MMKIGRIIIGVLIILISICIYAILAPMSLWFIAPGYVNPALILFPPILIFFNTLFAIAGFKIIRNKNTKQVGRMIVYPILAGLFAITCWFYMENEKTKPNTSLATRGIDRNPAQMRKDYDPAEQAKARQADNLARNQLIIQNNEKQVQALTKAYQEGKITKEQYDQRVEFWRKAAEQAAQVQQKSDQDYEQAIKKAENEIGH